MQFAYGEDGIDVTARSFMREFGFLARNADRFTQQVDPAGAERASRLSSLVDMEQEALRRNRCLLFSPIRYKWHKATCSC